MTAQEIIQDACDRHGVSDLADRIDVLFSDRMTATGGYAQYRAVGRSYIKLSTIYLNRATPKEIVNTIYHEVCHIIMDHVYGRRASPHGFLWKMAMRRCGQMPSRTHKVKMPGRSRDKRVKINCHCPSGSSLGSTQYKRMLRGIRYKCTKCGFKINLDTVRPNNESDSL